MGSRKDAAIMSNPKPQEKNVRDFVDRGLRDLLSQPANLRGFLGDVVPELVEGFEFEKMRPARREYFLGNWRSREADLLFEIPYRLPDREDWALVCVLLEHQTKAEWRTPLITLIYAALYWEWQLRQWESQAPPRGDFLLRPILPVVLHTGARPWGIGENAAGNVGRACGVSAIPARLEPAVLGSSTTLHGGVAAVAQCVLASTGVVSRGGSGARGSRASVPRGAGATGALV